MHVCYIYYIVIALLEYIRVMHDNISVHACVGCLLALSILQLSLTLKYYM